MFIILPLLLSLYTDNLSRCEINARNESNNHLLLEDLLYEKCILKISIENLKESQPAKPESLAHYEKDLKIVDKKIKALKEKINGN